MTTREVELTGGAPWGFRMHGGVDQNQPLRISRVNPGRKASLSGIREGDVISSINGQTTKTMSNAEAHAMLRSAGSALRLGLNEDKEMSPRRRSIGKTTELRRSFQLLPDVTDEIATPQPPVYATIRPPTQMRPPSSPAQTLNSLPSTLNSTSFKSPLISAEPFHFHPTNPFYTTLPSNHSNASKLPVPNGRTPLSTLDRNKSTNKPKDNSVSGKNDSGIRSPSYFANLSDSGPHSTIFSNYLDTGNTNGYNPSTLKSPEDNNRSPFVSDNNFKTHDTSNEIKSNEKNPFKTKRNSDPFDKFLRKNGNHNENFKSENSTMPISISDSDIHKNEQEINHTTITERKISETEEIKTTKTIIMNGSSTNTTRDHEKSSGNGFSNLKDSQKSDTGREHFIKVQYSPTLKSDSERCTTNPKNVANANSYENGASSNDYKSLQDKRSDFFSSAEAYEPVVTKPPLKSPGAHSPNSPLPKRE